jgi:tetratricopeptide (TPR) repeat protein
MLRTQIQLIVQGKTRSYRDFCIAAALSLGGLSPVWAQNSQLNPESPGRDLWRPRNRTSEAKAVPGEAERGWKEAASSSASPSEIKWKPSEQLPASPWDQPSAPNQPRQSTHASSGQSRPAIQVAFPHPSQMIRQPSSSIQSSFETSSSRPATLQTGYPTTPSHSERPYTPIDQRTNVHAEVPFDVRREQNNQTQTLEVNPYSQAQARYSNELPDTQAEYVSNAPSRVVGVVVGNGMGSNYETSIESRPLETFLPEQPAPEAMLSGPMNGSSARNDAESMAARRKLAGLVSADILSNDHPTIQEAPRAIEAPAGWKSVEEDLRVRLDRCDELLRRNAILSARDEILAGLRNLIRAIDVRSGEWIGEPALDRALRAFEEDADFHESIRNPNRGVSTAEIVNRHTTSVLKNTDLNNVSPELASQHYRNFVRQQLNLAAQQHPWAADLFYALGRTFERSADASTDENHRWRNHAIVCYQAALNVMPTHASGASQLGYALLKLDRVDEAHAAINHSIQAKPTADAWRNLAEVYRRRGQSPQAEFASKQIGAYESPTPAANVPEVTVLDPKAFAGISPNHFVGQASATQPVSPPVQAGPAATTKAGWFGKIWR